jgi:hypothetical protein
MPTFCINFGKLSGVVRTVFLAGNRSVTYPDMREPCQTFSDEVPRRTVSRMLLLRIKFMRRKSISAYLSLLFAQYYESRRLAYEERIADKP